MENQDEIPHDFRERAFQEWIRIITGNAVIHAQYVEKVLNHICLLLKTKGLNFTLDDLLSGDSSRTKQTLGAIAKRLGQTGVFHPAFADRLDTYVRRRNRVVHGLFADTFKSKGEITHTSERAMAYVRECEWVAKEGSDLVEVGFGVYRMFGEAMLELSPNDEALKALVHSFDEFHSLGIETVIDRKI